jgi:hypothetical protein
VEPVQPVALHQASGCDRAIAVRRDVIEPIHAANLRNNPGQW